MTWRLWFQGWPVFTRKGGPGSGHHGHKGRPGRHGGSAPSGISPPKVGKPVGGAGGTGTRYGYDSDGERFVERSAIKEDLYWGTPYPESVLAEGIRASSDEVNWHPGVSLGRTVEESRGYHEAVEGAGSIFRVKVFATKPVKYGSDEVKDWDGYDIGEFYKLAQAQGFDAVTGPGEVRVFKPAQVLILGHGMREWRPYDEK